MNTFQAIRQRLLACPIQGMFLNDEERSHLDQEIEELLASIAGSISIESADAELQQLGLMQEVLATLCFKYQTELSKKQRALVRRYDRWDDLGVRTRSFEEIRQGQFP